MGDPPPGAAERFSYLMQFTDGNRIDLTLIPSDVFARAASDSLTIVLLDKDGLLAGVPPPSDANYLPTPPSERAYADCCNEFWWMSTYVAKGLWRDELTYARAMLDQVMREELMDMLAWYVGVRTRFSVNVGKSGKYLRRYLEPELWRLLERTYADARSESAWEALFAMCRLFRGAAHEVGDHFGYQYPEGEDARVTAHLQHVRALPRTASEIY
jgi:aminoglycoside 6-adenylyltransferase